MAIRYKALTELYRETQRSVTAPAQWQEFLASACRNYRLSFDEQLLVYAQRPDAAAVLEIERWNRQFGRWVNRGANGIAVFDGNPKARLKYYLTFPTPMRGVSPGPFPSGQCGQNMPRTSWKRWKTVLGNWSIRKILARPCSLRQKRGSGQHPGLPCRVEKPYGRQLFRGTGRAEP